MGPLQNVFSKLESIVLNLSSSMAFTELGFNHLVNLSARKTLGFAICRITIYFVTKLFIQQRKCCAAS